MLRTYQSRCVALGLLAATVALFAGQVALGHDPRTHVNADDLFYNYYTNPGQCDGQVAQLYPSPRPAPPLVGYTYITYQPLMPHEFMYQHQRDYWSHNPGGGLTHTTVRYHHTIWGQTDVKKPPFLPEPQGFRYPSGYRWWRQ